MLECHICLFGAHIFAYLVHMYYDDYGHLHFEVYLIFLDEEQHVLKENEHLFHVFYPLCDKQVTFQVFKNKQ